MSQRRLVRSLMKTAGAVGESAGHSAVTLSARLPMFAGYAFAPSAAALTEWNRACSEKVTAGWEGALAAGVAWSNLMWRSSFRWPTPATAAHDLLHVANQAVRPAQRAVKANAKRLTRSS